MEIDDMFDDEEDWDSHLNALHRKYGKSEVLQAQHVKGITAFNPMNAASNIPDCSAQNVIQAPQEPTLVSYGLGMESCTLNFDGKEFRYILAVEAQEPYANEYGRSNGDGTYSVVIERGNPRNPCTDWPIKALYATPQPPSPCPTCATPKGFCLLSEYEELQAKVAELEKDQSQYCPDCEARANGESVLVPSAELKKLQATVAELKEKMFSESEMFVNFLNIDHPKALGERDRIIAEQRAEIERLTNDRRSMVEDVRHYHENEQTNLANIDELKELHSGAAFNAKYFKSHYEKLGEAFNEQDALIEKCEKGLAAVESLVDESKGVTGLHLNGDVALWTELREGGNNEGWLIEFDTAIAALAAHRSQS